MKGVTQTPHGFRARIRINGELHQQRFPRDAEPSEIRQWLLSTELKYKRRGARRSGRLGDDAQAYLAAVQSMPTFEQRKAHIEAWVEAFGERRRRDSITADEIRAQLQQWRTVPQRVKIGVHGEKTIVLSAASCNKRRTALMHLFTVLDGKAAHNPVKDVPKMSEPAPAPRALPYSVIRKLFAAMEPSRSKAHLMVLAYTGIPPGQIGAIQEHDVDFTGKTVAVAGRKKGKGTKGRIVPLTPDGVRAFKMMRSEDAWGPVSRVVLRRVFRGAARRVLGRDDVTPYQLRHSFGTEMYQQSGDIGAVQSLMAHSTPMLTQRYTVAAIDPRVAAAISKWRGR